VVVALGAARVTYIAAPCPGPRDGATGRHRYDAAGSLGTLSTLQSSVSTSLLVGRELATQGLLTVSIGGLQ
jgi:hypothetical protein